jgi:hypothetical protein
MDLIVKGYFAVFLVALVLTDALALGGDRLLFFANVLELLGGYIPCDFFAALGCIDLRRCIDLGLAPKGHLATVQVLIREHFYACVALEIL